MKLLCNIGAVASMMFVAVALFKLRSVVPFRVPIAALEKRLSERE
jgi:hypothetical protein